LSPPFGYYLFACPLNQSYLGRIDYPNGIGDNRLHFSLFSRASHTLWGAPFLFSAYEVQLATPPTLVGLINMMERSRI